MKMRNGGKTLRFAGLRRGSVFDYLPSSSQTIFEYKSPIKEARRLEDGDCHRTQFPGGWEGQKKNLSKVFLLMIMQIMHMCLNTQMSQSEKRYLHNNSLHE